MRHRIGSAANGASSKTSQNIWIQHNRRQPLRHSAGFWLHSPLDFTERKIGDRRFVDVKHGGTIWTYELEHAYRAEVSESGCGIYQWPEFFDVGWWVD